MAAESLSADFIRGYQLAIDVAARAADRRARVGWTGPQSSVVREMRAHFVAMVDTPMLEAFDRAVFAAFRSGAASAAYDARQLRDGFDEKEIDIAG